MLEALHFLRPAWLLALLPCAIVLWYWASGRAQQSQFQGRIDPALLAVLLDGEGNRSSRKLPLLLGLGFVAAVLGAAGPTWERLPQPVERDSDGLVIVLDLSLSMYVRDVQPSRLVRARQKITDILRSRRQGFTGLIAYAGDAHTVAPLTDDTDTITNLLSSLAPEMMPVLGSDAGAGIALAQELLSRAGLAQGRVLLITDGIDRIADVTSLRNSDYPLSILGVGTPDGAPIPLDFAKQPGRVLQTQQGDIIRARLDEERLSEVAELSYGTYQRARLGDSDIESLLRSRLPGDEPSIDSDRRFDQWADRGYWLALLLLPLVALSFRKGLFVSIAITLSTPGLIAALAGAALSISAGPAHAGWWQDLWQRPDQQAHKALREGSPERAAALFEDSDWRAIANYRTGEYEAASAAFAEALAEARRAASSQDREPVTQTYNLGNAQARLGQYQPALDSYNKVLDAEPEHADAAFNKALVEKLLDQQQQAGEQDNAENQQSQGQEGDNPRSSDAPKEGDQSNQQPGEPEDSQTQENQEQQAQSEEPKEGEQQSSESSEESQASRDADAEAMEQWLRRVPDDPGGLLRRKFQYETNLRLRNGEGRRQDQEKIW